MSLKSNSTGNILTATVYNTDGSIKTDLAHNTSGISIVVKRIGQLDSSALTLSAKAAANTAHAAGAFLNLGNGRISVDIADSFFADFTGQIWISGSYTGGMIVGDFEQVVGYDPTAVRVGAAAAGDAMALVANQDVRNVGGTLPAVTLAASQPNYAPLTSLGTNAPAGWLNAAAFASGSLNGKGDWSTADALSTASSTLQSMITALNNLSAKANWFGSLLLEVPDSGTRAYQFELVVRDDEDKLTNLDGNPTIALTNTAGTDRSSLITTPIANPSTGRYTLTISVGTSTVNEALKLTASGTISGETRYAVITPQVVDYDTATLINSIYTRIGAPAGASIAADIAAAKTVIDSTSTTLETVNTKLGTPAGVSMSADIAAVKTDTGNLVTRITSTLFSGITSLADWLRRLARKDTGTAGMITAAGEIATGGTATYSGATDNLEAIYDNGGGGGGSGDAEQATLLEVQATVESIATTLSGTPIEPTSRIASGGSLTAYIGDDFRVRSGTELEIPVADVGGALYTKLNAIGAANLYFGASREGADVGAITGTVAAITSVGSGASQTCKLVVEITNCGSGLKPGTYDYQIEQRQTQGSDVDSFIEVAGSLILKRNSVA